MTRARVLGRELQTSAEAMWLAVSAKRPCPVCRSKHGCLVHEENDFVSCTKEPSQWPLTNGTWLHRLSSLAECGGTSIVLPASRRSTNAHKRA